MGEFQALLGKNFRYWKRNTCGMVCEIATTLVFALFFVYIGTKSQDTDKPATSYLLLNKRIGVGADSEPQNDWVQQQIYNIGNFTDPEALIHISRIMKNCSKTEFEKSRGEGDSTGYVVLGPESNPIVKGHLTDLFTKVYNFSVKYLDDQTAMEEYINAPGYGGLDDQKKHQQVCFAILFEEPPQGSNKYKYTVHYNSTGNPDYRDIYGGDSNQPQIKKFTQEDVTLLTKQLQSGLFYLMNLIDTEILRLATKKDDAYINAFFVPAPTPAYKTSQIYTYLNGNASSLIVFPLIILYLRFAYNILYEKEYKIQQNLRNMGMSIVNYYMSWYLFYSTLLLILTLAWALMTKRLIAPDANFILYASLYFVPGMFFLSFALFITSFFTKAKSGILCCIIAYFVLFGVNIAKAAISGGDLKTNTWFALSPLAALDSAADILLLVQSFYQPFGFQLLNSEILSFKFGIFLLITISESVVFVLAALYFEQVIQKETGIAKHPLFCLKKSSKAKGRRTRSDSLRRSDTNSFIFEGIDKQKLFEDVEEELVKSGQEGNNLEIQNLTKTYSNRKRAVKGLSLTMYTDQIFALLGHNGAGKTTTISMISGLIPLTSGKITVLGLDSINDSEDIKEIMGVCPQTNPIYPTLTVAEHLYLYAKIKKSKLDESALNEEIDQILKDIDLSDKKNFPAGNLSGGQKRKLCVACAFIAGSKVILLDEPTSGLDVSARRHLWNMLKQYKKDKIIILTTHFMDEADYLGDRIGVMGDGRLLTCGSSLFLKSNFGFGYGLTLVKESSSVSTQEVTALIQTHVTGATLEGDISKELKYILPTSEIKNFEGLFQDLETLGKQKLGIESYGVSLTTLEDVFLRIGEQLGKHKTKDSSDAKDQIKALSDGQNSAEKDLSDLRLQDIKIKNSAAVFWMHFKALVAKRFLYFSRDRKSLICEIFLPIIIIFLGMSVTKVQFIRQTADLIYDPSIFGIENQIWVNARTDQAGKNFLDSIPDQNWSVVRKDLQTQNIQTFDNLLKTYSEDKRLVSAYVDGIDTQTHSYTYNLFLNTTAADSIHVGLTQLDTAVLRTALNDKEAEIDVTMVPLPLTQQVKSFEGFVNGFLSCFFIAIAYSFLPSSLIMFLVVERENNAKLQQIVSGVSIPAYWFSNLVVDYVKYLIPAIFTLLSLLMYDVQIFVDKEHIGPTIVLALLFGPCFIGFTYLTSFMFKGPSSAQVFTFIFSVFTGFILMIASQVLRIIPSTRNFQLNFLEYIFRLFPMFDYCFGMFTMSSAVFWQFVFDLPDSPKPWSKYGMIKEALTMPIMTLVFFSLIFLIEFKKGILEKEKPVPKLKAKGGIEANMIEAESDEENRDIDQVEDEVLDEVKEVDSRSDWAIKVKNLKKEYVMFGKGSQIVQKKLAVKGITFGVNRGDCFGLLGTNGAGKTTTFSILSGEIQPTSGTCEVQGMNVVTEMKKIREYIGFCPQFDALLNNLTAREHLQLYCNIKGIPTKYHEPMIQEMLTELNLTDYEHVQAGTYSGGNKRKLSVAIALLGNPPIVFLDEPSSGMDPEARRFMWSVVGKITSGNNPCSVVLTTHSMEEAEALSTKLAIMVEGKIKCIGPVQKLKNKYGKGFEIETKFREALFAELIQMLLLTEFADRFKGLNVQTEINAAGEEVIDDVLKKRLKDVLELRVNMDQVRSICGALQIDQVLIEAQLNPEGSGSFIVNEILKKGDVALKPVLEFFRIFQESSRLHQFMRQKFGQVSVLESYSRFIRTKVEDQLKLSYLFGEMERNKSDLKLDQYSVKETSIEQIFIGFAKDIEEDRS